jgi:hypothetical protein
MTLIVYKNGELAADSGCTRNDSREFARKIRTHRNGIISVNVGYSGNLDAIERHWREVVKRIDAGNYSFMDEYPAMNAAGIAVVTCNAPELLPFAMPHEIEADLNTYVFTFNCFDHATGNGVWVREHSRMVCEGADFATCSAIAIDHVAPHMSASDIIYAVAEVNSSVDTGHGIHKISNIGVETQCNSICFQRKGNNHE